MRKKTRKKILIVDDDYVSLRLASLVLGQNNFEVYTAKSGLDAISFLKRNEVDLILLDIEMPMMNGMKTLETIRKDTQISKTPVIFLTASADKETVVNACKLEVADYIRKPFVSAELLERVKRAL